MNEQSIKQVLEYLDVYEPGRAYIQGEYLMHPCPFAPVTHERGIDRHPSFGIKIDHFGLSYFNCFSCKQKGQFFIFPDLIAKVLHGQVQGNMSNVAYVLSLEYDSETFEGVEMQTPLLTPSQFADLPKPINPIAYSNMFYPAWESSMAMEYLKERGISEKTVRQLDLQFDLDEYRVVFPVHGMGGKLYGYTGRSIRDVEFTKEYPRIRDYFGFQKKFFMLGEHNIRLGLPIVVVEGLFGYAHLVEIGALEIVNVVALLGSVMTRYKARTLLNTDSQIYLLLDNDKAGEVGIFGADGVKGAIDFLKTPRLYIPAWPEGKKDPDELSFEDIDKILTITDNYPTP